MKASTCPNKFPPRVGTRRLAIVAESPGASEMSYATCAKCAHSFASEYTDPRGTRQTWDRCERCGCVDLLSTPTPLVGPSGRLLNKLLDEVGIQREECFVGNVTQRQPPRNEISRFKWAGDEIQTGLASLSTDLAAFKPQFVLCLGGTALKAMRGLKGSVDDWRGSLFVTGAVFPGVKAMATYHPARLLRESGLTGVTRFDMAKAAREARFDELRLPVRNIRLLMPDGKELLGSSRSRTRDSQATQTSTAQEAKA